MSINNRAIFHLNIAPFKSFAHKFNKMRFTIISLAIFMTVVASYSAEASLENAVNKLEGSAVGHVVEVKGNSGLISRSERRSFTSRSRAVTRANLQRRNGSLLPDIVLPSITSAQPAPAPAPARPIPQAVSYPASVPAAAVAAAPLAQNYYTPQPVAQSYTPQAPAAQNYAPQQPAVQNYAPQQPAVPSQSTTLPSLTLPTLVQAPKEKEDDDNDDDDDDDDEEEEDEDEEDEEDFDADDLVTRRRR